MKKLKIEVYKAKDGFRWHIIASNGKMIAESGEGYIKRSSCLRTLNSMLEKITFNEYAIVYI